MLDSFGIGEAPDAKDFGDEGSNTLLAVSKSLYFDLPNLEKLGLFAVDGAEIDGDRQSTVPIGTYGRMTEQSKGKDTTIGHWEIAGIISEKPLPVYPKGFPEEVTAVFEQETGRKILCNRPYSGTEVIRDYGDEHVKTGALIVYTSADSVFQIAAHEDVVPPEELYRYCKIARKILTGKHGVGRVIARPFIGESGHYTRTSNRHDFSIEPPKVTMLDQLKEKGFDVIGIGKIHDIFAGKGLTEFSFTKNNEDGIEQTKEWMKKRFEGLCFVNLVDFDMLYGHRNDVDGYAKALSYFDKQLPKLLGLMREGDILMITADHGCDPSTPSTDHSREYTPFLMYQYGQAKGVNLKTRKTFADIGSTVLDYFGIESKIDGTSVLEDIDEV
ncbi:phosphopentomutase [Anaerostipes caccae]|uniref:phosphopentomutase n=1 Tax=Anaerostipes caccae TaxID=105841 RepID=UPI00266FF07D|nr:phosphopentomutase [Anaerostipes caccae]